jgi:hypothetical protein
MLLVWLLLELYLLGAFISAILISTACAMSARWDALELAQVAAASRRRGGMFRR